MKILIAADGSPYTKRMLAYLAAHHEWLSPKHEYTVLHGVLAVPSRAASFVSHQAVTEFYQSEAEAVFQPIRAFFEQKGVQATFVYTVGQVADAIAERAAAEKFDVIVMGTRGHGELANLVLGSVANRVLAKTTVPVLLIR